MKLYNFYRDALAILILLPMVLMMNKQSVASEIVERHPSETEYLDFSHPEIQELLSNITRDRNTDIDKAIAIHNYVRDNIIFGFSREFYDMKASEVLKAGKGFCNNQSTLFAAMLRGAGIPARHRFYSLSSTVLNGIINTGTKYVDHAVVEVYLNDNWIAVDSYIVDSVHAKAVQPQLIAGLGMGMRSNASLTWDGKSSSFSQFHPEYVEKEFGIFDDVGHFYDKESEANNRFGFLEKIMFPLAIGSANKKVASIREIQEE